jgi:hypothetical protein
MMTCLFLTDNSSSLDWHFYTTKNMLLFATQNNEIRTM